MLAIALLLQVAASPSPNPVPPPPLAPNGETPQYWQSLQPISFSKRETVVCRGLGQVTAEFEYRDRTVRAVDIEGLSHRLSLPERAAINLALKDLGFLDRVSIGCNLRDNVLITITARKFNERSKRMVRRLSIVWTHDTMTGIGDQQRPVQETGPDLYG